ncbi:MAG: hypothetical protein JWM86_851 [Thermoleophilia bacterium]|nr:hypothetical protein [Thermoleophilia bacterium]
MDLAQLTQALSVAVQGLANAVALLGSVRGGGAPATSSPMQAACGMSTMTAPSPAQESPIQQAPERAPMNASGEWKIGSFNVLGASHTSASGNSPELASGAQRTPGMISYLKKYDVDVVGLQEFQPSQQDAFRAAKSGYSMHGDKDNVIAWKSDKYQLVSSRSIKVPYFEGKERDMPVVQLEEKATGKRAWFINVHNPADTANHHGQQGYRTEAMKRERELVTQLRASGLPVFIVGDFNERGEARSTMTAGNLLTASDPKSGQEGIDWVFGTGPVRFTGNVIDQDPKRQKVSDHPIVVATAQV